MYKTNLLNRRSFIYHQQITEGNLIPNIERCWDEFRPTATPMPFEPDRCEFRFKRHWLTD